MRQLAILALALAACVPDVDYDVDCTLAADCVLRALDEPCSECPTRVVNVRDGERASREIAIAREQCVEVTPCDEEFRVICDSGSCSLISAP